jgi:hypothetical protein
MVGSPDDILARLQEAGRRDLGDFLTFEVGPEGPPRHRPARDTAQPIDAKRLRAALKQTFTFRKTHALPATVPAPLGAWTTPYTAMAREDQLAWLTLDEVTKAAQTFLDPVLAGELDATWDPERWSWRLH